MPYDVSSPMTLGGRPLDVAEQVAGFHLTW
jgi:hypothetical protein